MGRRFLFILLIALLAPQLIYADAASVPPSPDTTVRLLVGRSTVVDVGKTIARVSLTSSDVADALVTAPTQLLVNGKMPGTISMFVWDRAGSLRRYEVTVERDVARLTDQVHELFPGEKIQVESNGRNVVLSGSVSTKDIETKALSLAGGYVDKKEEVINLLQVAEGGASNQVLLRVRFAEVSRSAMTQLGASFFTGANGYKDWVGRTTTEQYPAPNFDSSSGQTPKLVFSDFLNFFLFNTKHQLGTVIQALQTRGLFQSLAEPNLVAESGKEASFLAGGEIPVPIAQPSANGVAITVQWKEFGIRLNFTPVVNGDRVHLKVAPEVSSLDFNNAIVLQGFRIPALTTRKTETELELQDHQTFAIAGLLSNSVLSSMQKMPGIGDIPILGLLFKSKAAQKDQTELVVMITPEILRNNSVGVTNQLPRQMEPYLPPLPEKKSFPAPPAAFVPPSGQLAPTTPTAPRMPAASQPSSAPGVPDPATAAAAISALAPKGPQLVTSPDAAGTAAAPAATSAPAQATPAAARQLTPEEKKVLERARQQEEKQRRAEAEAAAKRQQAEAKAAAEQKKQDEKLAREQAKKDEETRRRDAEEAKRQAERDKKEQKQIEEAAAKLKAAQAAYDAELAKKQKQQ